MIPYSLKLVFSAPITYWIAIANKQTFQPNKLLQQIKHISSYENS